MLHIFTYQNACTKVEIWQLSIRLMRFGIWFCHLNRDFFFLVRYFCFFDFLQDNWYGFSHDIVRCILLLELWNVHQTDVLHLCRWLIVFDFVSFLWNSPFSICFGFGILLYVSHLCTHLQRERPKLKLDRQMHKYRVTLYEQMEHNSTMTNKTKTKKK